MPRDVNGNYTLPAGNPVVTDTLIASVWANSTMSDLGNEMSNSLDRNGNGGMLAPFRFIDGAETLPSLAFTSDVLTGRYLAGPEDQRDVVGGQDVVRYQIGQVNVTGDLNATDNLQEAGVNLVDKYAGIADAGGPSLGTNSIIRTNAQVIEEDITFIGDENGSTVGNVSIADGFTVTVTDGARWVIL